MGFHQFAQRVRDETLALVRRRAALKGCIGSYCCLINKSYRHTYDRFAEAFGFERAGQLTGPVLLSAISALESERRVYLDRWERFSRHRIRQKLAGRRNISDVERTALGRPDFFVVGMTLENGTSEPFEKEQYRCDLPAPRFRPGDIVRSVVGSFDDRVVKTAVSGAVTSTTWHWKRGSWMYKLALPDRRRRRWYLQAELETVENMLQNAEPNIATERPGK
jgi:hypothetical protein